jgi:hypothetical protein
MITRRKAYQLESFLNVLDGLNLVNGLIIISKQYKKLQGKKNIEGGKKKSENCPEDPILPRSQYIQQFSLG